MRNPQKETWWVRYRATLRAHAYAAIIGFVAGVLFEEVSQRILHLQYEISVGVGITAFLFIWGAVYTAIKDAPDMKRLW
jgi:hypothetical protein